MNFWKVKIKKKHQIPMFGVFHPLKRTKNLQKIIEKPLLVDVFFRYYLNFIDNKIFCDFFFVFCEFFLEM